MERAIFCAAAFLIVSGCVSVGHRIDQEAVSRIEKGVTTQGQVIGLLGSPDSITRDGSGKTIFVYSYARVEPTAASFIPVAGPLVGGSNVQHETCVVTFDSDGIVQNFFNNVASHRAYSGSTAGERADLPEVEQDKRPK